MTQSNKDQPALSDLEDDFYLGGYQSCINKASSMAKCREATFYMCLSYFHLGKFDMLKLETSKSEELCVKLIDKLVAYTQNKEKREAIIEDLRGQLETNRIDSKDDLSRLLVSSIFVRERLYADALKTLNGLSSLPVMLSRVSIYHQMHRLDLADKEVAKMMKLDRYNTLTLLATVPTDDGSGKWFDPDIGKAQELEGIYKPTPLIENLQTAAAISAGYYDTAMKHCQNALDLDNDNAEALINMQHILSKTKGSAQMKERFSSRLKTLYPDHEFVREFARIDSELA